MDNPQKLKALPAPQDDSANYQIGYGKPPVASRFQPGKSGNPKGRPKGKKNTVPSLSEERIKTLIMEEAYRTIPIVEKGRRINISMMTAILRAVAMNAAKGNNRAATLFTKLVSTVEVENSQLAKKYFGNAMDYKEKWTKELERRKKLNLKLPDPVPHPDDIVIDARKMEARIVGPWTREEIPRYRLAAIMLEAFQDNLNDNQEKLAALPEGPEAQELRHRIKKDQELVKGLRQHYGPREDRTKDPFVREVEELVGMPFEMDEDDEEGA